METRLSSILEDKGHKIFHIEPTATIRQCAEMMQRSSVGALLVLEEGRLIGIVSERDIVRKIIIENVDVNKALVLDIMTKHPLTVPPSLTVTEGMRLMTEKRFRHLPVIDQDKLIGVVSIGDLTRCAMLAKEREIETLTQYIRGETK
jgi:CBS domain-containing protein